MCIAMMNSSRSNVLSGMQEMFVNVCKSDTMMYMNLVLDACLLMVHETLHTMMYT